MGKAQELQTEIDRILNNFIDLIEKKTMKLETMTNQTAKRILEQDLDKEIHGFVAMKDKLVSKFKNIVDEGV